VKRDEDTASPVAFPVNVARLARGGLPVWLEADADQRAALAEFHGLLAVDAYRFDAVVEPWQHHGVRVTGTVKAKVTQACIVTLEPVPATVEESFEGLFVPERSRLARPGWAEGGELLLDADGPDAPEPFSGDHVDVGALAEEFFELALDPYPRAKGASLAGEGATAGEPAPNPFRDKLAALVRKS
jgi:hypothetical protein